MLNFVHQVLPTRAEAQQGPHSSSCSPCRQGLTGFFLCKKVGELKRSRQDSGNPARSSCDLAPRAQCLGNPIAGGKTGAMPRITRPRRLWSWTRRSACTRRPLPQHSVRSKCAPRWGAL